MGQELQRLEAIGTTLRQKNATGRLYVALGLREDDDKTEAHKYISSVLAEVQRTASDPKRDLTVCTPESIVQTMIDAANFRVSIDGRKHAYIVKYFNKDTGQTTAQLQIGFGGYIAKLAEQYTNFDVTAEPVYEGDIFTIKDEGGYQSYEYIPSDPFCRDLKKLKGVFVALYYEKGNRKFQKITVLSNAEIQQIREKAKQDYIWDKWLVEKAKAAAIKRASKIHFLNITGLQEMVDYDNRNNYDMDKPELPKPTIPPDQMDPFERSFLKAIDVTPKADQLKDPDAFDLMYAELESSYNGFKPADRSLYLDAREDSITEMCAARPDLAAKWNALVGAK